MTTRKICILALLGLSAGCTLTEKSVSGQWVSGTYTLLIQANHSFLFAGRKNYAETATHSMVPDTGFISATGKWQVSAHSLLPNFDEDKKMFPAIVTSAGTG